MCVDRVARTIPSSVKREEFFRWLSVHPCDFSKVCVLILGSRAEAGVSFSRDQPCRLWGKP